MGIVDDIGIRLPNITGGSGFVTSALWAGIIFIVVAIIAIIGYIIWDRRRYKYKVIVFENLGGRQYSVKGYDRARLVKVGDGGEEILYLKKNKCFRTAYGKKMSKNTYWFAIGQDGYWYNIILGDLDAKRGELDIEPIDRDMRYMHVAIRKNIQDRYRKIKFMEKYGTILFMGIFLIIMLIGIWFLLGKMAETSQTLSGSLEKTIPVTEKLFEKAENIVSSLDNICTGGSGIVPAPV